MKALLQRVSSASVTVNERQIAKIGQGLLILLGVEKGDQIAQADYLAKKSAQLRIFKDENGKMNRAITDIQGQILVVSQFTLAGDTSRGNRPGFDHAETPERANELYQYFSDQLRAFGLEVQNGIFQADMKVSLINDGPVTFMLEK